MSVTKQRVFTVKTDVGIMPAGIKVHDSGGQGVVFPVQAVADMIVFYRKIDHISIDPSSTPSYPDIIMGQYKADKTTKVVNKLVKIIGDRISGNQMISMNAVGPRAARPEIGRLMWTCTGKNKYYSAMVDVKSNRTLTEYGENKWARYPIQYDTTVDGTCDSCDDLTTCIQMMCSMVDQFNGKQVGDGYIPYIEAPKAAKAFVYRDTDYTFQLSGVESDCAECTSYTGIKGVHLQGKDYIWGGTLNAATSSHVSQLQTIVDKITESFPAHQGTAWIGQATFSGSCLIQEIKINTCVDGVKLIKHDGTYLEGTTSSNTFTKTSTKLCVGCGENGTDTVTYTCAIGFIGPVAEENCHCDGKGDNGVRYYPTNILVSDFVGFNDAVFQTVQTAVAPANFGVQLWDQVYRSDPYPGMYDHIRRTGGEFNHNMDRSRVYNVDLSCPVGYCVISWDANAYGHYENAIGLNGGTQVRNEFMIPIGFATATALVADLNALKNYNNLAGILDIACAADTTPAGPTPSISVTPFATPSITPSVSASLTRSVTPSVTPTVSSSATPSVTRSTTPSTSPA